MLLAIMVWIGVWISGDALQRYTYATPRAIVVGTLPKPRLSERSAGLPPDIRLRGGEHGARSAWALQPDLTIFSVLSFGHPECLSRSAHQW